MKICVYIHTYIYTYIYIYIYIYTYIHVYIYRYIHIYIVCTYEHLDTVSDTTQCQTINKSQNITCASVHTDALKMMWLNLIMLSSCFNMFYLLRLSFWANDHVAPVETNSHASALGQPSPRQDQNHVAARFSMDPYNPTAYYLTLEHNDPTPKLTSKEILPGNVLLFLVHCSNQLLHDSP